jgi:hypothetical protein
MYATMMYEWHEREKSEADFWPFLLLTNMLVQCYSVHVCVSATINSRCVIQWGYRKVRFLRFFIPPKDVLKMVQGVTSNMKNALFFAKVSLVYVIELGDL